MDLIRLRKVVFCRNLGSNRGYAPIQLLLQFMLSVWCGANRFAQTEVTRHDPVLEKLSGFKRMANFKAIMRLFGKFDQATNMRVFGQLYRWFFGTMDSRKARRE